MSPLKKRIQEVIKKALNEDVETEEHLGAIVNPIDHAKAVGSEPVTDEPEVVDHATGKVVKISDREISLSENHLRSIIRKMILSTESTQ